MTASPHYLGYLGFWMLAVATLLVELAWPRMRGLLRRVGRPRLVQSRPRALTGATVHRLHTGR